MTLDVSVQREAVDKLSYNCYSIRNLSLEPAKNCVFSQYFFFLRGPVFLQEWEENIWKTFFLAFWRA